MKSMLIKTIFLINILFILGCKAQTSTDYINHYNEVVPKLNSIIPNKTQFYGQNFSTFYTELQNKNILPEGWIYDTKISPSKKYYVLKLFFYDMNMLRVARENSYRMPRMIVTFENEIPYPQVQALMEQYHAVWNPTVAQFFSTLKVEKIEFTGVKGYNSDDFSE
ncbi:hypothetical protein MUU74_08135 [Chryseobacterium daecheongense]|uniref:hypothetical protein n=1 Tax=Chryseobacterium daecheongense TaxID=192389 RepID=UPI001FD70296|nr:hypothetical protein [Chryseobacterium daecheongense]UOU99910.1 hypothetical protein MUU74_08135 [Chryseobacterium daecheongense]